MALSISTEFNSFLSTLPPKKRIKQEVEITPLALRLLEILRGTYYIISPNAKTLESKSPINYFRTEKLSKKYLSLEKKISNLPASTKKNQIGALFDKAKALFKKKEQSLQIYGSLSSKVKNLIEKETNNVVKIKPIKVDPFLICMNDPLTFISPLQICPKMLLKARELYTFFKETCVIESLDPSFDKKIKKQIKTLIYLFSSYKMIMDSFEKMFVLCDIPLKIIQGETFGHESSLEDNESCIIIKNSNFIEVPVSNISPSHLERNDPLEFQTREFSLMWVFHELLHHDIFVRKINIPPLSNFNKLLMTNEEEIKVIGIINPSDVFSVNYLRKMLFMPFRTRHLDIDSFLQGLNTKEKTKRLIFKYLEENEFSSLLDLEYRTDLEESFKPKNILPLISKIQLMEDLPLELKPYFTALGYPISLTKEQIISYYTDLFQSKTPNEGEIYDVLNKYPIPQEVLPIFFKSSLRTNYLIQKHLVKITDGDKGSSLLIGEIIYPDLIFKLQKKIKQKAKSRGNKNPSPLSIIDSIIQNCI
jgi:hypothetical protein